MEQVLSSFNLPAMATRIVLLCAILGGFSSTQAIAHESNTGYILIGLRADSLYLTYKFDITDLERVFSLDQNDDQVIDRDELLTRVPEIYHFIETNSTIRLSYLRTSLARLDASFEEDRAGNLFINFHFAKSGMADLSALNVEINFFEAFGSDYKVLGRINRHGELEQMIFTNATPLFKQEFSSQHRDLLRQFAAFVFLGIEHIFIGADHIMFLFGLLVIGGRFMTLVKIVTSFTISHSITLVLAALQLIVIPGWFVESAIALSIVYIACENFFVQKSDRRWLVTGFFGLVHGFGFANVLGDLGLPTKGLLPSLLAFNVGVEIGQIVIVTIMLPVIWALLHTRFEKQVVWIGSAVILVFGATWFLNRAFDLPVALI